jgi:uncharacterized protein
MCSVLDGDQMVVHWKERILRMLRPAIVVTGASSGIGREIARFAAREGAFMLLLGRSLPALEELAAALRAEGAQAAAVSIDLSNPEAGDVIERTLSDRGLYCDVLVNSAGFGLFGAAAELDRAEQLNLLDVNARALTDLTLRFIPGMVMRRRGGVLNVGSLTGFMPGPQMAVYYAAKNYVQSFSAALATELANTGVTVTCMCPGPLRGTAFFDRCTTVGHTRLSKIMPRSNARQTAEAGWRRFKAGGGVFIPRFIDRVIAALVILLPRAFVLRLISLLQNVPAKSVDTRSHTQDPCRRT